LDEALNIASWLEAFDKVGSEERYEREEEVGRGRNRYVRTVAVSGKNFESDNKMENEVLKQLSELKTTLASYQEVKEQRQEIDGLRKTSYGEQTKPLGVSAQGALMAGNGGEYFQPSGGVENWNYGSTWSTQAATLMPEMYCYVEREEELE
jgi:hypothetical protein